MTCDCPGITSTREGEPALPASFGAGGGKVPLPALPSRRGPDYSSSSEEPLIQFIKKGAEPPACLAA